eukprot:2475313-Rhodomonas_salina.3
MEAVLSFMHAVLSVYGACAAACAAVYGGCAVFHVPFIEAVLLFSSHATGGCCVRQERRDASKVR